MTVGDHESAPSRRPDLSVLRPWLVAGLGVVGVVWGWRAGLTWPYVVGLVVAVIGALRILRDLRDLRPLALAGLVGLVALLGVGGPWLGARLAYAPVGVEAPAWVESFSHYVTTVDGGPVLLWDDALVALDEDGAEAWTSVADGVRRLWSVSEDRLVTLGYEALSATGTDGADLWSRPLDAEVEYDVVAMGERVVVLRSCTTSQEGSPAQCTWAGVDVDSGDTVWQTSGTWAAGWSAVGRPLWDDYVSAVPSSLVVVRGASGTLDVHDATTGDVVQTLPDDGRAPVLVGGELLLVQQSGDCSVSLMRDGEPVWVTELDCARWPELEHELTTPGVVVAGELWTRPAEETGTVVVDLADGTVRYEGFSYWAQWFPYGEFDADREPVHVLGAGVQVDVDPGGLTVRDPGSGERLWSLATRGDDIRSLQLDGEVLVLTRYTRPLLLHEWLAPQDPDHVAVDVYDVRTGERRASARPEAYPWSPLLAGDRVVLDVADLDGRVTLRIIGG